MLVGVGKALEVGLAGLVGRSGAATVADTWAELAMDVLNSATLGAEEGFGEEAGVETGGSAGVSSGRLSSSECRPMGFSGRRSVPLLARGVIPMESQIML